MKLGLQKKINQAVKLAGGFWDYNVLAKLGILQPSNLMINLTYKCNSHCMMCNIWQMKPDKELSLDDWKKIMADPIIKSIKTLTVSGGEAFLFNDYVEAIRLFVESMTSLKRLVLNTNGFLTDMILERAEEVAKICKKNNITLRISVSIDGVGKAHDEIRGTKGGFDKADKTIDGLVSLSKKYNFQVGIASLLIRQNIDKYEEVKKWMKSKKTHAYSFQIVGFHETFVNNMESEKEIGFGAKVKKSLMSVLDELSIPKGLGDFVSYYWADMKNMYQNNGNRTTPCPFLTDEFVMDSLGDVYYCLSTKPIGNVLKENRSVSEIYFDKSNIKIRKQLKKHQCKKCNSGCDVYNALAFDAKRYFWFRLTGKVWPRSI